MRTMKNYELKEAGNKQRIRKKSFNVKRQRLLNNINSDRLKLWARDLSVLNMTKVQFKNCINVCIIHLGIGPALFSMFYNHLRALIKYLSCSIKTCQYTECQENFEL